MSIMFVNKVLLTLKRSTIQPSGAFQLVNLSSFLNTITKHDRFINGKKNFVFQAVFCSPDNSATVGVALRLAVLLLASELSEFRLLRFLSSDFLSFFFFFDFSFPLEDGSSFF